MNPSTPGIIASLLSHRAVEVVVVDLGAGCHVRLQDLFLVVAQVFVDRILGVLEVHQLPGAGGAGLATSRGQPLGDSVVTERALVGRIRLRMEITAAVRAGLDAIAAAQAVVFIHQDDAIGTDIGGAHGADLMASSWWIKTTDRKSTR